MFCCAKKPPVSPEPEKNYKAEESETTADEGTGGQVLSSTTASGDPRAAVALAAAIAGPKKGDDRSSEGREGSDRNSSGRVRRGSRRLDDDAELSSPVPGGSKEKVDLPTLLEAGASGPPAGTSSGAKVVPKDLGLTISTQADDPNSSSVGLRGRKRPPPTLDFATEDEDSADFFSPHEQEFLLGTANAGAFEEARSSMMSAGAGVQSPDQMVAAPMEPALSQSVGRRKKPIQLSGIDEVMMDQSASTAPAGPGSGGPANSVSLGPDDVTSPKHFGPSYSSSSVGTPNAFGESFSSTGGGGPSPAPPHQISQHQAERLSGSYSNLQNVPSAFMPSKYNDLALLRKPYQYYVFDFDNLISSCLLGVRKNVSDECDKLQYDESSDRYMLKKNLPTQTPDPPHAMPATVPDIEEVTAKEFGGAERVLLLQELFATLNASEKKFWILSRGREARLKVALRNVGLLQFFDERSSSHKSSSSSPMSSPSGGKGPLGLSAPPGGGKKKGPFLGGPGGAPLPTAIIPEDGPVEEEIIPPIIPGGVVPPPKTGSTSAASFATPAGTSGTSTSSEDQHLPRLLRASEPHINFGADSTKGRPVGSAPSPLDDAPDMDPTNPIDAFLSPNSQEFHTPLNTRFEIRQYDSGSKIFASDTLHRPKGLYKGDQIANLLSASCGGECPPPDQILFLDDNMGNLELAEDVCCVYQPQAGPHGTGLNLIELRCMIQALLGGGGG